MKKYTNVEEYIEDHYLDDIIKCIKPLVIRDKDSFENSRFTTISTARLEDAHVTGVTFKDLGNNWLEIRTSINADIEIKGNTRYGFDSDSTNKTYNVFFKTKLDDKGLHNVTITNAEDYNRAVFDREKSLSHDLIPYMYEEDVDKHAEDFLRRNYPKALIQPMCLPTEEIAKSMGMEIYYAPMDNKVFGKTYFGAETVIVYDSILGRETKEIVTKPGTMLINPQVFYMYNIGTANNTIIHECVHWDRHQKAFELQKLLAGDSNHISCEIIEKYEGIPVNSPAIKWMEWQANQLAPRILMPAQMTKRIFNQKLADVYQSKDGARSAEIYQEAVLQVANFFQVSIVAAKLRLIELDFEEVKGTWVYCDEKLMPPYAFKKRLLSKNQDFVIDEQNLIIQLSLNPDIAQNFANKILVYANHMLCLNSPKYVYQDEKQNYVLTEYALEHVDECCYVFERKYNVSNTYSDTFYKRCFLCREMNSDDYVPAVYDPNHKINQSKKEMKDEIDKIMKHIRDEADDLNSNMLGGFSGALKYYMKHYDVNVDELSWRSGVSNVSISNYRNNIEASIEPGTALALCKGLYLSQSDAELLLNRAGCNFNEPKPSNLFVRLLITHHMDDTWEQWVEKLIMSNVSNEWIPNRNTIVKKIRDKNNN